VVLLRQISRRFLFRRRFFSFALRFYFLFLRNTQKQNDDELPQKTTTRTIWVPVAVPVGFCVCVGTVPALHCTVLLGLTLRPCHLSQCGGRLGQSFGWLVGWRFGFGFGSD